MQWKKLFLLLPWTRKAREHSLEDELQSHLKLSAQDAIKEGATPQEAQHAAKRELGSTLRAQEAARQIWSFQFLEQLQRDCVYSARSLHHAPSFAVVAILSLGLGIGAATAIFSLLNTVLLKPLAYGEPSRLINIREVVTPLANVYPSLPVNYQHFLFWREHSRSFQSLAAVRSDGGYLTGTEPLKVDIADVSYNFFAVLDAQPSIGRGFLPEEGQRGRGDVAVITDSLWSRRFGRDPHLLGRTITLNHKSYTVVGILPYDFHFFKNNDLGPLASLGKNTEIFLPLVSGESESWGGDYDYVVFGRLRPDASLAQARAELDILEHRIDSDHRLKEGLHVLCTRLQNVIPEPVRTPLYVLMGAVALLLLLVCLNLANLALARSGARVREYSIRTALGAGRATLIRQLLAETVLLGIVGGALGFVLAVVAVRLFTAHASVPIPRLEEVQIDSHVLAFCLLLSVACGLLSGLVPAFRTANNDSQESLRAGSHHGGTRHSLRTREILIGTEVAIGVVLLFGAGWMTASLAHLLSVDKGFTAEQAVAFQIAMPYTRYKTPEDDLRFWDRALESVRSVPGVQSAAYASKLPLTGESMVNEIAPEGASTGALDAATGKLIEINVRYVSPDYFTVLGIPLVQGRFLKPADRNRNVAVISKRLSEKVWPGQNPLGRSFTTGAEVGKVTIVGVVKDVHTTTLDREPTLMAYVPYWHRGFGYGNLVVRTAADPKPILYAIGQRLKKLDASLPAPDTITIRQLVNDSLSRRYFQAMLSNGFAVSALALALIGIYGVVAYTTTQRRKEIAIRLALGASPGNLFRLLVATGFRPLAIGFIIGLLAALLSAQFIRSLLFGVRPTDPLVMLIVLFILAASALCACLIPAKRALALHPASALRDE